MSNHIDTRDLYTRKSELEDLRDAVTAAREELESHLDAKPDEGEGDEWEEAKESLEEDLESAEADFGDAEQAELAELEELESYISDFRHGETMIPEHEFEDYARQLAEDIGAIPDDASWPCTCIDWEQAARELAMDYTTVTYQGEDYLVRS